MKSLVAILFLINCLAFFMLGHLQNQSETKADQRQEKLQLPLSSPTAVILLSELSDSQLQALEPAIEIPSKAAEVESADVEIPVEAKPQ